MKPIQIQPRRRARSSTRTVFVDNFFYGRANRNLSVEVVPHLGLMSLAAVLEKNGHGVEIFDPKILFAQGRWAQPDEDFLDRWAERLLDLNTDVIGFTAYGRSLPYVVRVANRVKHAKPGQKIILGGPHATIVGQKILKTFDCFDTIVRYEAESLIVDLIEDLSHDREPMGIPNLLYRKDSETVETRRETILSEMDTLPEIALHLYPIKELRLGELSIEAGRGCPFDCTFCSTSRFFQRRYRLKSNVKMLDEMAAAQSRYGINIFNLNHDLFGLVKKSVFEFCELARGRKFNWKCSMRPDTLNSKLIAALTEAGCRHIYFGLETGSPRLQKLIKKNLKLDRSHSTIDEVVKHGIHCTTSFITGFPEETELEQDQTLDLIGTLLRLDPHRIQPQLHVLSPEPGCALAEGDAVANYDGIGPEVDELVDDELIRGNPEIFSVFYHYQSATPRWRIIMASAFVSHLLSEIGYPLTTHIVENFFSGSLAKLFRETVRDATEQSLSYDEVINFLRRGFDGAITRLGSPATYLCDLVRLSRVLAAIRSYSTDDPSLAIAEGQNTWLACFDFDVLELVKKIMLRPDVAFSSDDFSNGEHWVLLNYSNSDKLEAASLEVEPGRWLSSANSNNQGFLGKDRELFRGLGVSRIHY